MQQDNQVIVPAQAQAELDARVRDEEKNSEAGPVMVNGVALNLECLSTLRPAATSLGLEKSGGKATALKRISDHLKKQQLIQQHQVRADLCQACSCLAASPLEDHRGSSCCLHVGQGE